MRFHRFYIKEKINNNEEIRISDPGLLHQWRKVFRFRAGNKAILFDGNGIDFECEFVSLEKSGAVLKICERIKNDFAPKRKISLYFSLIKNDNAERIVQKCAELGVSEFFPVISERSEKKKINVERAEKIIIEACEQSGRGEIPKFHEPVSLEKALENISSESEIITFDPSGISFEAYSSKLQALSFFVGPEGGWTEKELQMFRDKKISIYSLGKQILRAETVAIAVSAIILI